MAFPYFSFPGNCYNIFSLLNYQTSEIYIFCFDILKKLMKLVLIMCSWFYKINAGNNLSVNFITLAHNFCWWIMKRITHKSTASTVKKFNSAVIFVIESILLSTITDAQSVATPQTLSKLRWYSAFYLYFL
jgi:hypothetical protein